MKRVGSAILLLWFTLLLQRCDHPFAYSPFDSQVPERFRNTTELNLAKIKALDTLSDLPFRIALISDSHYHFQDLAEAVQHINNAGISSFIIVNGDITENGLLKEYEIFHDIMSRSRIPYLTVIGNHDHLANGAAVYQQMFGPANYTFIFNGVKFVIWDNTAWESKSQPDINWLIQAIDQRARSGGERTEMYHHTIPVSHIPPFDGQAESYRDEYIRTLKENEITFSVHGHKHEFFSGDLYGDGVNYITIGSPQKRSYALLSISAEQIKVDKVVF